MVKSYLVQGVGVNFKCNFSDWNSVGSPYFFKMTQELDDVALKGSLYLHTVVPSKYP